MTQQLIYLELYVFEPNFNGMKFLIYVQKYKSLNAFVYSVAPVYKSNFTDLWSAFFMWYLNSGQAIRRKFPYYFLSALTRSLPITTVVPYANSLDSDKMQSNSASHPYPSCLTLRLQTTFSPTLSDFKSLLN